MPDPKDPVTPSGSDPTTDPTTTTTDSTTESQTTVVTETVNSKLRKVSYENIYSILLGKIRDYDLLDLEFTEFEELMTEKAQSVFANPNFRGKFVSFSADDEVRTISFELSGAVDEEYDKRFVTEVVAEGITVQWLKPYVNNALVLSQFIGTAREKFFSQSSHFAQIEKRLHEAELSFDRLLTTHGFYNNTYFTDSKS